jgi:hypothetical protein
MTRIYSVTNSSSIDTIADIVELRTGASHISVVHGFKFGQVSDAGDAESEQLSIDIFRATSGGSAGTDITDIFSHKAGDAAARSSVISYHANGATVSGSPAVTESFNVIAGMIYMPTPEERIIVGPNSSLVFALTKAPADAISTNFTLVWEEIGG